MSPRVPAPLWFAFPLLLAVAAGSCTKTSAPTTRGQETTESKTYQQPATPTQGYAAPPQQPTYQSPQNQPQQTYQQPAYRPPTTSGSTVVYYAPLSGEKYHSSPGCRGLANARNVSSCTPQQARAAGLTPCRICGG